MFWTQRELNAPITSAVTITTFFHTALTVAQFQFHSGHCNCQQFSITLYRFGRLALLLWEFNENTNSFDIKQTAFYSLNFLIVLPSAVAPSLPLIFADSQLQPIIFSLAARTHFALLKNVSYDKRGSCRGPCDQRLWTEWTNGYL